MEEHPVDGALVSSLVAQLYGAVRRDFDSTYSNVMGLGQDPTSNLQITGSIMRASVLDGYRPTVWEQENLDGHQAEFYGYPDKVLGPGVSFEYGEEETRYAEAVPDDDDDSSLEKRQAIAAVAAYIDNTFTDAALESADLLEIIQRGTRYTVEKLEAHTKVINQTTGATLSFSDDFEDEPSSVEDEGFTAQDYENLKALNERLLHEISLQLKDKTRKYTQRQKYQRTLERESDFEL